MLRSLRRHVKWLTDQPLVLYLWYLALMVLIVLLYLGDVPFVYAQF